MTRIVLFVLIIVECFVQGILTYWWYKYKSGAYYNLVIKKSMLYHILCQTENILLIVIAIILFYLLIKRMVYQMNTHGKIQVQNGINKMINMTDEQVVEKLIGILQPIYQEGRLTEDEVNEIFYYATIGNSMVEHGYE